MNWVSINHTRGPDGPLPCAELLYLSVNPLEMQCVMFNAVFKWCIPFLQTATEGCPLKANKDLSEEGFITLTEYKRKHLLKEI